MMLSLYTARRERARIFAEVIAAEYLDMSADDILGRSRVSPIPAARHRLMAKLWETGMTLSTVARVLDMDHTSVLHGVRKVFGDEYATISPGPGRTR